MKKRFFTVVLETYDGQQYGMLPLGIDAYSKEEAERLAIEQAEEDGWERIKLQFTLGD